MTKHDHKKPKACKHEFNYCDECDVVYCKKCEKEWKILNQLQEIERAFPKTPLTPAIGIPDNFPIRDPNGTQRDPRIPYERSYLCQNSNHTGNHGTLMNNVKEGQE